MHEAGPRSSESSSSRLTTVRGQSATSRNMLERAAELFAERGYDAVSVREIVDAVGVSKPVLYYHWKNKEGVARAIIADFFEQALALRAQAFAENEDLAGALTHYARGMLELAQNRRATLEFGLSVRFGRTSLRVIFDEMREHDRCMVEQWGELISQRGVAKSECERVARTFWSLLFSELLAVLDCPERSGSPQARAADVVNILFHGVMDKPRKTK